MKHLLYILLLLISFQGVAQEPASRTGGFADKEYYLVDSLVLEDLTEGDKNLLEASLKEYHVAKDDTSRINALNNICEHLINEEWIKYQFYQYDLIKKTIRGTNNKMLTKMLARALNNMGVIYQDLGQVERALNYHRASLKIKKKYGDRYGVAESYNGIAIYYNSQGQIREALNYYGKSLKIFEELGEKFGTAECLNNIGIIFNRQEQPKEAIDYLKRSLKIREDIGDKFGVSVSLDNLGVAYQSLDEYKKALKCSERALLIQEELGSRKGIASSLNNIGNVHFVLGKFDDALNYQIRALKNYDAIGDKSGVSAANNNLGAIYERKNRLVEALEYTNSGLKVAREINSPNRIQYAAYLLAVIYEKQGKGIKALEMYKLHVQMRDSINNEATQKATIRQQTQYDFEKAQIVKENEAKEQARVLEEETGRRNNLQYSFIFLGILVLFGIVMSLGFIKVSNNVAEGLIFFAFLILFEFLLVFTEPYLENYTNGEPMYNLLANSVLAIMIFPVHAILEKLLKKRIVKV